MEGDVRRSRLVCWEIKMAKNTDDQLGRASAFSPMPPSFSPMPPLDKLKMLVTMMMNRCGDGNPHRLPLTPTTASPLHRVGRARRGAAAKNGNALENARRRKERTHPELAGVGSRERLVVPLGRKWEVGRLQNSIHHSVGPRFVDCPLSWSSKLGERGWQP